MKLDFLFYSPKRVKNQGFIKYNNKYEIVSDRKGHLYDIKELNEVSNDEFPNETSNTICLQNRTSPILEDQTDVVQELAIKVNDRKNGTSFK